MSSALLGGAQNAQVSATPDLDGSCGYVRNVRKNGGDGERATERGFSYGICERFEVISARNELIGIEIQADDVPTARGGQAIRMQRAEVVAVRLGGRGQWPKHCGAVAVHIRQGGHRTQTARGF